MFKKIMVIDVFSLTVVLGHTNLLAYDDAFEQADKAAQRQQANVAIEETVSVPFDEAQAREAMQPGENSIKGVLYHTYKLRATYDGEPIGSVQGERHMLGDVDVMLFPLTAHIKEQRRLENENKKQRQKSNTVQLKRYMSDPRTFDYMLSAKTDAQGRFNFQQIKPGRYLVYASDQTVTLIGSERVKLGQSTVYGETVNHYEDRPYEIQKPLYYETEIEVKSGQKELKVDGRMSSPGRRYTGIFSLFN